MPKPPTTVLVVLDGWGVSASSRRNAVQAAATPNWDRLWAGSGSTMLDASGRAVGLPEGQMGNSEVGHLNLGAGRVVHQHLTRIDNAIDSGEFAANAAFTAAIDAVIQRGGQLHVLGLLSPGGVHSHEEHIAALLDLAKRRGAGGQLRLHAFLDGRDTPPQSAGASLRKFAARFPGVIASIVGRYYAMDRDTRWERTERAFNLLQRGEAPFHFSDPAPALTAAYARGETDEFVQPTAIHAQDELPVKIQDGDAVVWMNFRADRARQLARAFVDEDFPGFRRRSQARLTAFVTLTQYADDIPATVAFAQQRLTDTLGECLEKQGMTQLRLAETEKYAHVTYFFSGGREAPFAGEQRLLVPSPTVATYDLAPAMSAPQVTDALVDAIDDRRWNLIVCNYANGDMVGHTGDFDAAVQAVETIDECLGRLRQALRRTGSQGLITADHGNVECMADGDAPHTAHTTAPVPLVYAGPRATALASGGRLADVAPTLLALMGISPPQAMTGRSLLCALDTPVQAAG